MATESSIIERFNADLIGEDWKAYNEYKSISALVIRWENSDNPGFEEEAFEVGKLFENDLSYNVEYYAIPSISSQRRLDDRINSFFDNNEGSGHLMIIHYGGHGDADDDPGQEKLAIWAA